jgi:hypothetical protein
MPYGERRMATLRMQPRRTILSSKPYLKGKRWLLKAFHTHLYRKMAGKRHAAFASA